MIDAGENLSANITASNPDVVFNALHGRWGEDGCVQGLLSGCKFLIHILEFIHQRLRWIKKNKKCIPSCRLASSSINVNTKI